MSLTRSCVLKGKQSGHYCPSPASGAILLLTVLKGQSTAASLIHRERDSFLREPAALAHNCRRTDSDAPSPLSGSFGAIRRRRERFFVTQPELSCSRELGSTATPVNTRSAASPLALTVFTQAVHAKSREGVRTGAVRTRMKGQPQACSLLTCFGSLLPVPM